MSDENPYEMPQVDESEWFRGGHLGTQVQAANWQVVNCTTPANYFHVLRRQVGGLPLQWASARVGTGILLAGIWRQEGKEQGAVTRCANHFLDQRCRGLRAALAARSGAPTPEPRMHTSRGPHTHATRPSRRATPARRCTASSASR